MSFKDYSLTPASNTTLGDGTYIGPNMFRNKVRPALQQLAADGRDLADQIAAIPAGPPGPAGGVSTVAGREGDIVLSKADVGLSFADNTSDANKPVSTAQATALALKASKDYDPPYTGGVTRSLIARLGNFVFADDFCVGDGTTDDAAKLQLALNTGKRVWLDPAKTYAIGATLVPPSNGGFIGRGKLLMLTGTGKFDKSDYSASLSTRAAIHIDGKTNVRVEAIIEMQANAGIRTATAISVYSSTNINLDVECFGFKETFYGNGVIEWNTNVGGSVKAYVHDCAVNTTTLALAQITALNVDGNRVGGVNSTGLRFDVYAKNLTMNAAAVTKYGQQTDGVNIQGTNGGGTVIGHTGRVIGENVYEPLDCYSDGNIVDVIARDCLFGVKLIHGASYNVIRATVDRYQKAGVTINGAAAGSAQATRYNRVYITARRGGEIGSFGDVCGAIIDSGYAMPPTDNYVEATVTGDGVNLDYGAMISDGTNNEVRLKASGYSQAYGRIVTASNAGNILKRGVTSLVRAYPSATQTYADLATIICNSETIDKAGEYNPTTGIWTALIACTVRARIKGQLVVAAGGGFGSYIYLNSTSVSRQRETNTGTLSATLGHENSVIVNVVAGDTISFKADGGGNTWNGGPDSTFIEIEEL